MRRILAALCLSLGLVACGGTLDSPEDQAQQPAQQEQEVKVIPPLLSYCWVLEGTGCSPVGKTQNCTDGIWTDYVCTCRATGWDCPEVR
ncbi:hypothetical protein [Hyalangium versicolor]|uniref:hypothetical protein n=1 Tax=Hyalangium versicolor TaxID=2861190 RepID=UPI001CCF5473|nr:hypothetical protein [Hyalangium versicolor]